MTEEVPGTASCPSIEEKYGKPIGERQDLVRARRAEQPDAEHRELVGWLEAEHGMGHGHADALVAHTLAQG